MVLPSDGPEAHSTDVGSRVPVKSRAAVSGFVRFIDWLLCRPELQEARRKAALSAQEKSLLQRAISAFDAASAALEAPAERGDTRSWGSFGGLFLDSLYWCLLSSQPDLRPKLPELDALWSDARPMTEALRLTDDQARTMATLVAMKRPALELSELPEPEQRARVELLRVVALRALELREAPGRAVTKVLLKISLRIAAAVIILLGIVVLAAKGLTPAKVDITTGKPWTVSSKLPGCDFPAVKCLPPTVFFHTAEEDNPWLQYDLRPGQTYSSMKVMNRPDGYGDRAVPLVIEVSDDGKVFREIARQDEPFEVWEPSFEKQTARFVRLRVAKRSYLHLERVQIYR